MARWVWRRNGKKQLPARVRHQVNSQRQMTELLEKIILEAHFQGAGSLRPEMKERQLKAPHREPWPCAEELSKQAQDTQRAAIEILLEQSHAYGESVQEAVQEAAHAAPPTSEAAPDPTARSKLHTPTDHNSEDRDNSKGSVIRRPEHEKEERSPSRSMSKRVPSKKPGLPRTPTVSKKAAGWSHIRLAATALTPFGGLGAALKKTSNSKHHEKEDPEEDASKNEEEQEEGKQEEAEAAPAQMPAKATMFDTCFALAKQFLGLFGV
ncbi:unnamed protein product [Symbiodinium natans]|uniref:Uncharacterized protein n=1 Tax=Symbiodinium natans TaxID=878477 RepID=A0A812PPL1_9DINO|nr:unnamed protein product [Symbiodinium natans]